MKIWSGNPSNRKSTNDRGTKDPCGDATPKTAGIMAHSGIVRAWPNVNALVAKTYSQTWAERSERNHKPRKSEEKLWIWTNYWPRRCGPRGWKRLNICCHWVPLQILADVQWHCYTYRIGKLTSHRVQCTLSRHLTGSKSESLDSKYTAPQRRLRWKRDKSWWVLRLQFLQPKSGIWIIISLARMSFNAGFEVFRNIKCDFNIIYSNPRLDRRVGNLEIWGL